MNNSIRVFSLKGKVKCTLPLLSCLALVANMHAQDAQQSWDELKSGIAPQVAAVYQADYEEPYRLPLAQYGWEDGLQISRNGLDLYALYAPMDLVARTAFLLNNVGLSECEWIGNMDFLRPYANTFGMDLTTNPFECDSFPNIDILYSHRNSTSEAFTSWELSGIARPFLIDGGPAPVISATNSNIAEIFMFTGDGDIWMLQNTDLNPIGTSSAVRLSSPINPETNEFIADNAFLARVDDYTIVMIYEKYTDPGARTFMMTQTTDSGDNWSAPTEITTVTNALGHIEHPSLHQDANGQWWLYYSLDYDHIVRSMKMQEDDWDSWSQPEVIISKGNALAIGEPTVTATGDISFSLAYINESLNDDSDKYDIDPWMLPIVPGVISVSKIHPDALISSGVFPNPAASNSKLAFTLSKPSALNIVIYNALGDRVLEVINGTTLSSGNHVFDLNMSSLSDGLYSCVMQSGEFKKVIQMIKTSH